MSRRNLGACATKLQRSGEDGQNQIQTAIWRFLFAIYFFAIIIPIMLYIVRHGQTDWNLDGKVQGQVDIPLNDTGRAQAAVAADKLARFNLEYIISSDLARAGETAQIIANKLNIRVEYEPRLREYDFGCLNGITRRRLDPNSAVAFFKNPTQFGAESFEDAFVRVGEFFKSVDYNKNILTVTHSGFINFALCYLEGKNKYYLLDKFLHTKIDNSDVLRLKDLKSDVSILKNTRFYKLKSK